MGVRYGGKKGVRVILWFGAWATGSRAFPFTVMEKTAGGIRLWRKSQQLDPERMKAKMSVMHPSGEAEETVGRLYESVVYEVNTESSGHK